MKKIILLFLLVVLLSFICNVYVEEKLRLAFLQMKMEHIKDLEHYSSKNFYTYGIENIGESLQKELIKMNANKCRFNIKKDYFYLFQNKVIYISNPQKCLKVTVSYNLWESLFKIKGFQSCN